MENGRKSNQAARCSKFDDTKDGFSAKNLLQDKIAKFPFHKYHKGIFKFLVSTTRYVRQGNSFTPGSGKGPSQRGGVPTEWDRAPGEVGYKKRVRK